MEYARQHGRPNAITVFTLCYSS